MVSPSKDPVQIIVEGIQPAHARNVGLAVRAAESTSTRRMPGVRVHLAGILMGVSIRVGIVAVLVSALAEGLFVSGSLASAGAVPQVETDKVVVDGVVLWPAKVVAASVVYSDGSGRGPAKIFLESWGRRSGWPVAGIDLVLRAGIAFCGDDSFLGNSKRRVVGGSEERRVFENDGVVAIEGISRGILG